VSEEKEYDLAKSKEKLGALVPVLRDVYGNVIDGYMNQEKLYMGVTLPKFIAMPYAKKEDKAAQMRKYRKRKKAELDKLQKLANHWNWMAQIYAMAHPTLLDTDGRVITCDGKWYYEKFKEKGLTWNPCENCPHRPKCVKWEGTKIWKKKP